MNSGKRTLQASMSSLIDLKAELLRKQEALKQQRLKGPKEKGVNLEHKSSKSIWDRPKAPAKERAKKDDIQDISQENEDLQRSRAALEHKAKLYEQLTSGRVMPDDEQNELYMVNFQQKAVDFIKDKKVQMECSVSEEEAKAEKESNMPSANYEELDKKLSGTEEDWIDYTDSLGRSRRCLRKDLPELIASDEHLTGKAGTVEGDVPERTAQFLAFEATREHLREEWEAKEAENAFKGDIHYGDVRFQEAREHGVGFYDLSGDAAERKKQLELLNKLRDQTVKQKEASARMKEKRKAVLESRLARIRQKKNIKIEETEDTKGSASEGEEKEDNNAASKEEEKTEAWKVPEVRPWDEGKNLAETVNRPQYKRKISQRDWVEQHREERIDEFAPPSSYSANTSSQKYRNFARGATEYSNTSNNTGPSRPSMEDLIAEKLAEFRKYSDTHQLP
ncbi:coiled-coil domain-containing protein 174-like [Ornithodoros turicata]|uniref:coiled-coil domain-containing protein 174-like n=1 Tax=Ornithodoros turicata TaxID=34597 RepID=UPI003139FAC2